MDNSSRLALFWVVMLVAAVQIQTGGDIEENLELAVEKIREAAEGGAQLIVLPEATSQAFGAGRLDKRAQGLDGNFVTTIRAVAQQLGVTVVLGMFTPADTVERDGKTINRVTNTALIAGPDILGGYEKIHTYDSFNYKESDTAKPSGFGAWLRSKFFSPVVPGQLDEYTVCTGRAVQAGGPELRVVVDGVSAKRPVNRVTFYRHLRDLQVVRP